MECQRHDVKIDQNKSSINNSDEIGVEGIGYTMNQMIINASEETV